MRRAAFVRATVATLAAPSIFMRVGSARPCDAQADPACQSSDGPSLRVLLGHGDARASDEGSFTLDGRRYRGHFTRTDDGQIVNIVPLAAYLYSVVPAEMPHAWPAEALGAQAIVARTYALQRSSPTRAYDVVASESDQVYTGTQGETVQTSAAVDQTAGTVLRYGNGFATIAYSSCCGGHTEAASDAWLGGSTVSYLRGVSCTYCTDSPWYTWSRDVPMDRVQQVLSGELDGIGSVQNVRIGDRDASGRAKTVHFSGDAGSVDIKAAAFRRAIGTRDVPSLLWRDVSLFNRDVGTLRVSGGGLGHGVGLCQWGARGMAKAGMRAREIVAFYFPGTIVGDD